MEQVQRKNWPWPHGARRGPRHKYSPGVYFIEMNGFVKIGYARDVVERLRKLRWTAPNLAPVGLAYIPVSSPPAMRQTEAELHRRFASDRMAGEWFRPSMQLLFAVSDAQPWPEAV